MRRPLLVIRVAAPFSAKHRQITGEEDRRSRKVRLTAKGEELWVALAEPIHHFYDQALNGLSFDDRLAFIHYISLLQKNMSKL
jgi:DNA-binding MarR family transcriptional regulator